LLSTRLSCRAFLTKIRASGGTTDWTYRIAARMGAVSGPPTI
jgi:hypothetical protein